MHHLVSRRHSRHRVEAIHPSGKLCPLPVLPLQKDDTNSYSASLTGF